MSQAENANEVQKLGIHIWQFSWVVFLSGPIYLKPQIHFRLHMTGV